MKTKTDKDTELIQELLAALRRCLFLCAAEEHRQSESDAMYRSAVRRTASVMVVISKAKKALALSGER